MKGDFVNNRNFKRMVGLKRRRPEDLSGLSAGELTARLNEVNELRTDSRRAANVVYGHPYAKAIQLELAEYDHQLMLIQAEIVRRNGGTVQ